MGKIIVFSLFHRQNFVGSHRACERNKTHWRYRLKTAETQSSDTGISILLFFVDIGFLLVSLKHKKFLIPIKLKRLISILIISCKLNFSSSHAMNLNFNKSSPLNI